MKLLTRVNLHNMANIYIKNGELTKCRYPSYKHTLRRLSEIGKLNGENLLHLIEECDNIVIENTKDKTINLIKFNTNRLLG